MNGIPEEELEKIRKELRERPFKSMSEFRRIMNTEGIETVKKILREFEESNK